MSILIPRIDEQAKIKPREDGLKHINVWSKAKTQVGQLLSNFAHTPFRHPVHGFFVSVEGYWYWCASGRRNDQLRRLHGSSARSVGQQQESVPLPESEFHDMIREGLSYKVFQNKAVREALADSRLPLEHYFVYGKDADVVVNRGIKHYWQLIWLDLIRKFLRKELVLVEPSDLLLPDTMVVMADGSHQRAGDVVPGDELRSSADTGPALQNMAAPIDLVQLADGSWKAAGELQIGDEPMLTESGEHISGYGVMGPAQPAGEALTKVVNDRLAKNLQEKVNESVRDEISLDDIPF